jgi:hypothetical protein
MRFGRRSFVFWTLGLLLWAREAAAAPIGGRRQQAYPLTALAPYLDILIPRDETGSATDFGVDRTLIDQAGSNKRHMRLLRAGCKWLDFEARKTGSAGFADLDPAAQEEIVAKAADARGRSLPRVFFNVTRRNAFRAYYADPASWRDLGYRGPPQPEGYMDFTEAPR